MSAANRRHVVIVGGGFAGLAAVQSLYGAAVRITLVDRRNHHLFQPLLYQVATAALSPGDIAEPIRHILSRQENVQVLLDEAVSLDADNKTLHLRGRSLVYDWLVLAAGATHSYFGNDTWGEHALGLKTVGDALEIRRRMLLAFETAEWCEDADERRRLLTFAVIGGGPTGVELAGAISEIATQTLLADFRHIDTRSARVLLIEAQDQILGGYPDDLRTSARRQLEALGVEVRCGARVTSVDARGLDLGDERIDAGNMLWAAGVKGEAIGAAVGRAGAELDRNGRVKVNPDLSLPARPEIFVVGDLALLFKGDEPLPGVAQVAMQSGRRAGANILADIRGKPRKPFVYRDKGKMATIGRRRAVADLNWMRASGLLAWSVWALIHILFLISFRNRIVVFWKWFFSYVTQDRGTRIVWQDENWRVEKR